MARTGVPIVLPWIGYKHQSIPPSLAPLRLRSTASHIALFARCTRELELTSQSSCSFLCSHTASPWLPRGGTSAPVWGEIFVRIRLSKSCAICLSARRVPLILVSGAGRTLGPAIKQSSRRASLFRSRF